METDLKKLIEQSNNYFDVRLDQMEELIRSNFSINGKSILDSKDVMHLLKVTERCLYNWRRKNKIPFFKIESKIFYKASEIYLFLQSEHFKQTKNKSHG